MNQLIKIFISIAVFMLMLVGLNFIINKEDSLPLHDMDLFISSDGRNFIIDAESSNLNKVLKTFDFVYYQNIDNPKHAKMFYMVEVTDEVIKMKRYEDEFDKEMYVLNIEPADDYYFITDMDADINLEVVSHTGFKTVDTSVLKPRVLRVYGVQDDGTAINPNKLFINFKLNDEQAEFSVAMSHDLESKLYSVKIIKDANQ